MSALVWLNGDVVPASAARIDPADRGFTLGDGVFETIRADAGGARHLDRHFARLREGAAVLGIPVPFDDARLSEAIAGLLAGSGLREAALRLTLSRGPAVRGVLPPPDPRPTMLLVAAHLPAAAVPARVVIAHSTCRNERSPLARIKSLSYLDGIIARREAAARGADDALLLDTRGRVAEATAANLVVVLGGAVFTPPLSDGALPGIARAKLLESGAVRERSLSPQDLERAEAAMLVSSLGARMVSAIERLALDPAHPMLAILGQ